MAFDLSGHPTISTSASSCISTTERNALVLTYPHQSSCGLFGSLWWIWGIGAYHTILQCGWADLRIHSGNNPAGVKLILGGCKQNVGRDGRRRPVMDKKLLAFQSAVNMHLPTTKCEWSSLAYRMKHCEVVSRLPSARMACSKAYFEALAGPGKPSGV